MPGSPANSSLEALFKSTDFFSLSPSLIPSATAFVSRLRAAVSRAVLSRISSGLSLEVQAERAARVNPINATATSRMCMAIGCRVAPGGWRSSFQFLPGQRPRESAGWIVVVQLQNFLIAGLGFGRVPELLISLAQQRQNHRVM